MILTLIVPLLVAVPAVAQTVPEPAAPPEKKVCRREEVTGSIMAGKKTCHTKAEWKQIDAASQSAMDSYHNRSGAGSDVRNN